MSGFLQRIAKPIALGEALTICSAALAFLTEDRSAERSRGA